MSDFSECEVKITTRTLMTLLEGCDTKKWQIGFEVGKNGYRHYQGRFICSRDDTFDYIGTLLPCMRLEKGEVWCNYESKTGYYISSEDFTETRKTRFGIPNDTQKKILKEVKRQTVREVDVWYDPKGNTGKSWLCNWAYETHQAWYIPPTLKSVQAIIQDCASKMQEERRPMIIIDIPRSWKWTDELYTAIETIKDGLIDDPRYSSTCINIRGVKVLVLTNYKAKVNALSIDRWVFNGKYASDGKTRNERKRDAYGDRF